MYTYAKIKNQRIKSKKVDENNFILKYIPM
jgi:hypothetical protein